VLVWCRSDRQHRQRLLVATRKIDRWHSEGQQFMSVYAKFSNFTENVDPETGFLR